KGANFGVDPGVINGLIGLKPSLVTLANNHILDKGSRGLFETIDLLNRNNLNHIGAGKNLLDAQKPFIIEDDDLKVGFYTCAEHEFTIATKNRAGANPFDP